MNWLWIVLISVGALAGIVALIGALTPVAHVASRAATFHRPPDEVFGALADVAAYPKWRTDISSVEILPDSGGHAMWKETGKWGAVTMERTESAPPRRLGARIADTDQGFGGTWTWELEEVAGGTRLTITERGEVHNIIFRFMARYIFGYTGTMDAYLRQLGQHFGETVEPADAPAR